MSRFGHAVSRISNAVTSPVQHVANNVSNVTERAANNPANAVGKLVSTAAMAGGGPQVTALPGLFGFGQGTGATRSIMPGSGGSDYIAGGRSNMLENQQNAADQASLDRQNATQQGLIDQLYSKFGIGDSGDAKTNAAAIEGSKNSILNAYQQQQQSSADTNYLRGLTQARESSANSGQLNSSSDQAARNSLFQAYAGNNAAATTGRTQAGQSFDTTLAQQRQQQEDLIRGRQVTNTSNMGADIASLKNAAGSAYSNAAASAIPMAANIGSNYALANAYGNSQFNKPFGR